MENDKNGKYINSPEELFTKRKEDRYMETLSASSGYNWLESKSESGLYIIRKKLKEGSWFFHNSGIDITIGDLKEHFGGILIRGIEKISPKNDLLIEGHPLKVCDELLSNLYRVTEEKQNIFSIKHDEQLLNNGVIKKNIRKLSKEQIETPFGKEKYQYLHPNHSKYDSIGEIVEL